MENFKFILLSVVILAMVGLVGYWAVRTLSPGDIYVSKQKQKELEQKNEELTKEVEDLKNQLAAVQSTEQAQPINEEPTTDVPLEPPVPTSSKYQSLINDLQKLIVDKVLIKEKSQGTRVGTIQTFFNIYNKTSKRVDNDFGAGTKTDLVNFQKAVGLPADGQAGATTFQKMIDWLQKQ